MAPYYPRKWITLNISNLIARVQFFVWSIKLWWLLWSCETTHLRKGHLAENAHSRKYHSRKRHTHGNVFAERTIAQVTFAQKNIRRIVLTGVIYTRKWHLRNRYSRYWGGTNSFTVSIFREQCIQVRYRECREVARPLNCKASKEIRGLINNIIH